MKKLFLGLFLTAFAGTNFAQMPEIVNPPKPKKEYKLLLVVKYKETRTSLALTEYFYTDSFRTEFSNLGFYSLIFDFDSEWCIKFENIKSLDQFSCVNTPPGFSSILWIVHDPWDRLSAFLIAEAPNLALYNKLRLGNVNAQPAKVVFTK